jgi:hypothetical protein
MDYKKQRKDLKFGFKSEKDIHKILEDKFGELKNTADDEKYGKYFEFDKYNDNYFIEMKTRRILHNQYPTLFFGENKLKKGDKLLQENPHMKIFYLWKCNDKIVYWQHRSSPFNICPRGRWDRGKQEIDDCVDIQQKYIKSLDKLFEEE